MTAAIALLWQARAMDGNRGFLTNRRKTMATPSNLNRIFHALRAHHGYAVSRRQLKKLAVLTTRQYPNFHRFVNGADTAPWLG